MREKLTDQERQDILEQKRFAWWYAIGLVDSGVHPGMATEDADKFAELIADLLIAFKREISWYMPSFQAAWRDYVANRDITWENYVAWHEATSA